MVPMPVEHDGLASIEAVAAEGGLQLGYARHHEELLRGGVGELALQVEKIGARDVAGLERLVAGDGAIGHVAARRHRLVVGRAVVEAEIGVAELGCELLGGDEGGRLGH
ncbi:hypothetical protein ACVWW7_005591 [Bradyrhizobium sp. LM6.9]